MGAEKDHQGEFAVLRVIGGGSLQPHSQTRSANARSCPQPHFSAS
jgi:hypothetical protein